MLDVDDGYESYYTNRLWQLLPGVYRASDSDVAGVPGPLQELVARLGTQVAVVRRSIDRLWSDQSIETCDDWVIPYVGDLLDCNLIDGLDARGQRLDVAKTIHYRRRKGTLAVLEELARDVTGCEAHVVEAFRRLSRTRHALDPPVGLGALAGEGGAGEALLRSEGLRGALTGSPAGGFADLRAAHGAALADSAFEECAHIADLRAGAGGVGRYGIAKLLVFLWRLQSFAVLEGTPVAVAGCPGQYVFDPTGRNIPLFLAPLAPESDDYADAWTPAREWQVPGPLSEPLERALADAGASPPVHAPYPDAAEVGQLYGASADGEAVAITTWPQAGQFSTGGAEPTGLLVSYQYGFPATIGAGPYDRTLLGDPPVASGAETVVAGGAGLDTALAARAGSGVVTIEDSRTYTQVLDVGTSAAPIGSLLLRAGAQRRPVIRLAAAAAAGEPPASWTFTGGAGAELTLDGLLLSGGDIVLRGAFASVRLTGFTADPGTLAPGGEGFARSVDGRELGATRVWIEADPGAPASAPGAVEQLSIDHSLLGPIRTRNGGAVESATITDSVVQGLLPQRPEASAFTAADIYDPQLLAKALGSAAPVSKLLFEAMPAAAQKAVSGYSGGVLAEASLSAIAAGLSAIVEAGTSIYSPTAFAGTALDPRLLELLAEGAAADPAALNRALILAAYPAALAPLALAFTEGEVTVERTSVIGASAMHRLRASDSIFSDFTLVEDTQDGCVRYSAVAAGSRAPRQYRSATIARGGALFTSTAFGEPGYAQLLETADRASAAGTSIAAGAESGSEMGAYSSVLAPVKERGLLIKFGEYMPLGLTPVIVHVT